MAVDAAGGRVSVFMKPVTIRLSWPDANNDGLVDGGSVKEELLGLYYLEPISDKWTLVAGARPDRVLNTLEADVSHFSVYSIRTQSVQKELGDVKAYPNPCYLEGGGLKIDGIPADATGIKIIIYNAAGDLVRTLRRGEGIDAFNLGTWDGKNSSGAKAASGLYIYQIRTDNYGKAAGKAVILW
jgi:hypothetical protein